MPEFEEQAKGPAEGGGDLFAAVAVDGLSGPSDNSIVRWDPRRRCPVPTYLTVRPLAAAEATTIEHLARSRTAPARAVERAQIIWQAHQGARVPAIARTLGVCEATVRLWLRRFQAEGLDGLRAR